MTRDLPESDAFCLHVRPYRETSSIVHFFTRNQGKVSAVVKGVKTATKSRKNRSALLQPFIPLGIQWIGKKELKTLTSVEMAGTPLFLQQQSLLAGIYINELLSLLLVEQFECGDLYQYYQQALKELAQTTEKKPIEIILRRFEKNLLEKLGYGIAFHVVDEQGFVLGNLSKDCYYRYVPESGFIKNSTPATGKINFFKGECLLEISSNNFEEPEVLLTAKHLMRQTISVLLGGKVLNSRLLFS